MKPNAAFILNPEMQPLIYPPSVRHQIDRLCRVTLENCPTADMADHTPVLAEVNYLFSGWGCPKLDASTLALMPKLKAVFYGSGSIHNIVTEAFWERDIPICSAWAANAIPVAEFTVAQIILSLKQVLSIPALIRRERRFVWPEGLEDGGAFGTTVALISLGQIGRRVARMLQPYEINVLACDPFCSPEDAAELGVELTDLATCFSRARVVSLHTPLKPETRHMIGAGLIESMPLGATLINTARGGLIDEVALAAVLTRRPDLTALLDVTDPEPPTPESPLFTLENCHITPHIAGSIGNECARLGQIMTEECQRLQNNQPLNHAVTRETARLLA